MPIFDSLSRSYSDSTRHRVLAFSLVPLLLLGACLWLSNLRAAGVDAVWAWVRPSVRASTPAANPSTPTPPESVAELTLLRQQARELNEQIEQGNEALALSTQKLQRTADDLTSTQQRMAQVQWDLALSRQQILASDAERDRALAQVKDLTEQLRKNYLELNSSKESLEALRKEAAADKERLNLLLKKEKARQNRSPRPADND